MEEINNGHQNFPHRLLEFNAIQNYYFASIMSLSKISFNCYRKHAEA